MQRSPRLLFALPFAGARAEQYVVYSEKPVSAVQPAARALSTCVLQFATASVVSTQFVWLFGGTSGGESDTVYSDLWVYTVTSGVWASQSPTGTIPQPRRGASMVSVENARAYVYGGSSAIGETTGPVLPETSDSIMRLTLTRTNPVRPDWQPVTVSISSIVVPETGVASSGAFPIPRQRHTATMLPLPFVAGEPNGMVVFGGQDENLAGLNDVHAFHFSADEAGRWYALTPSGAAPAVRLGHSACSALNNLVIFGGTNPLASPPVRYSDVHILNLGLNSWSQPIRVGANAPSGREGHTMQTIGSNIYVFGGVNHVGDILDDLWSFSVYSAVAGQLVWMRPIPMSATPPPRWGHVAVTDSFSALIFGGLGADAAPLADVHSMRAGCGGNSTLTAARGSFGDGDGEYLSNLRCTWTLTPAVANANVRVSLSELDLIDSNDKVIIYDGDTSNAPRLNGEGYTGQILPPSVTSSSGSIVVQFISDSADVSAGFNALYEAVCAPGHTFNAFNNGCEPCPTGSYAAGADSSSCLACAAGSYADTTGSVGCTDCATYATTPAAAAFSAISCACQPGYVSNGVAGVGLACSICSEGGQCPGGDIIRALPGWCAEVDALDPTVAATPVAFHKCCESNRCPGGSAALCDSYIGVVSAVDSCSIAAVSWESMGTLRFTLCTWISFLLLLLLILALCFVLSSCAGFRLNDRRRRRIGSVKQLQQAPVLMNRSMLNQHHVVEMSSSSSDSLRDSEHSSDRYSHDAPSQKGADVRFSQLRADTPSYTGGELVVVALDDFSREEPYQPTPPPPMPMRQPLKVPPPPPPIMQPPPMHSFDGSAGNLPPSPPPPGIVPRVQSVDAPDSLAREAAVEDRNASALNEVTPSGMDLNLGETTPDAAAADEKAKKVKKVKKKKKKKKEGDEAEEPSTPTLGEDGAEGADEGGEASGEVTKKKKKKKKKAEVEEPLPE